MKRETISLGRRYLYAGRMRCALQGQPNLKHGYTEDVALAHEMFGTPVVAWPGLLFSEPHDLLGILLDIGFERSGWTLGKTGLIDVWVAADLLPEETR